LDAVSCEELIGTGPLDDVGFDVIVEDRTEGGRELEHEFVFARLEVDFM